MTATGPLIFGTGANDSSIGGASGNWANPGNITANDTSPASGSPGSMAGGATHYLKGTNCGFSLASDQVIDGIEVTWYRKGTAGTTIDNAIRIVKGGTIGSTDKSVGTSYPGSYTGQTYGGPADLWGETWLYSDINASNFGAVLSAVNSGGDSSCDVDYGEITVYHHRGGPPPDVFIPIANGYYWEDQMHIYLKQSTASQEVMLPQMIDETDGSSTLTGLTIANTDIKLHKFGATSETNKNSGGATHIADGRYYAVFDATDTDTIGDMTISLHPTGALPRQMTATVLHDKIFDWWFGSVAPGTGAALDAAGIRSAVGLGSANLDSQLSGIVGYIDTEVASILSAVDTEIAAIKTVTDAIGATGSGLTAIPWNAAWDAEVQSEVDDALIAKGLDHLVFTSVAGADVADNSIFAKLVSKSSTADWDTFTNTTDSLEALRDRGDAAWATGGGVNECKLGVAFTSSAGTAVRFTAHLETNGQAVVIAHADAECTVSVREQGAAVDLFSVTVDDSALDDAGVFSLSQSSPGFTSDRVYVARVEINDGVDTWVSYQPCPVFG